MSGGKVNPSYSWILVGASTLTMFGIFGASGSFGVFFKPLVEEFECTRAVASWAMSMVMGLCGLIGMIAGRLTDRYGGRVLITVGAVIGGLGYLLMHQATSLWELYFYYGIMAGIAMGTSFTPLVATVSKLFAEKRVLAVGITTCGNALGQMVVPPLIAYYISIYSWRPAYVILAIMVWVASVPVVLLLGKKPPQNIDASLIMVGDGTSVAGAAGGQKQPPGWSVGKAVNTLPFWMFMVTAFVTATGLYFMIVHIVAYATDVGIAATSAALILTAISVGSIISQLMVWSIASRMGSRTTVIILIALQALAMFLLGGVTSLWMLLILGFIFGLGFGGNTTVRLSMVVDIFGVRLVGAILGLIAAAWAAGGIFGPIMAGYIYDLAQSYNAAFLTGGLLLTAGFIASFFLKAPGG